MKIRVVLDTNVFISAMLFGGEAEKAFEIIRKKYELILSKDVLQEYIRVLSYPKFSLEKEEITFLIEVILLPASLPIKVTTVVNKIKNDPEDNKFLSLALDGKAKFLVSGDKDLLTLKTFRETDIVSIRDFLVQH